MLKWDCTKQDFDLISKITGRALSLMPTIDQRTLLMDLNAVHANGCPIDLAGLLTARNSDFIHDITGIQRHIDRETGQLTDCFTPRCARRQ